MIPEDDASRFENDPNCGNHVSIVVKIERAKDSFNSVKSKITELKSYISEPTDSSLEARYVETVSLHEEFFTNTFLRFESNTLNYYKTMSVASGGILSQFECSWMLNLLN